MNSDGSTSSCPWSRSKSPLRGPGLRPMIEGRPPCLGPRNYRTGGPLSSRFAPARSALSDTPLAASIVTLTNVSPCPTDCPTSTMATVATVEVAAATAEGGDSGNRVSGGRAVGVMALARAATEPERRKPATVRCPAWCGSARARRRSRESAGDDHPRLAGWWQGVQRAHAERVRQHWAGDCVPRMQ